MLCTERLFDTKILSVTPFESKAKMDFHSHIIKESQVSDSSDALMIVNTEDNAVL